MRLLDAQRAYAHTWTLRLGEKDSRGLPRRLADCLRITSPARQVCELFTARFGGEVRRWEAEWEARIEVTSLPVVVLPGQSLDQAWERWDSGGCTRRCDGQTCTNGDGVRSPCQCPPDIDVRLADARRKGGTSCLPTSRLFVACPAAGILGVGLLTTRGWVAAQTLPSIVDLAQAAMSRGSVLPAELRARQSTGRRQYVMPVLDIVGPPVEIAELGGLLLPGLPPSSAPVAPELPEPVEANVVRVTSRLGPDPTFSRVEVFAHLNKCSAADKRTIMGMLRGQGLWPLDSLDEERFQLAATMLMPF